MTNPISTNKQRTNWAVIGHEWTVEMLKQQIIHDSLRHAYLFVGPPGVGRRTMAIRLTQALNCPNAFEANEPCGTCQNCRQIEAMQYSDFKVVQAEKEGGVLKVESVRDFRQTVSLKAYQSRYRVTLFLRFHEANANASNALLKTLEEAPEHSILILTADNQEALLPTIVSRCEVMRLRTLPLVELEAALIERGASDEQASLLAHLSGGKPGLALRMMADATMLDFRRDCLENLEKLLMKSRQVRFSFAEKLSRDKDLLRRSMLQWLIFWRDVLLKATDTSIDLVNIDYTALIEKLARQMGIKKTDHLIRQTKAAIDHLDNNSNLRLLTETTLLDWPTISL